MIIRGTNQEFRRKPIQIFAGASCREQEQLQALSIPQILYWKAIDVVYYDVLLYSTVMDDVLLDPLQTPNSEPSTSIISSAPVDHNPNVRMIKKKCEKVAKSTK